jgi:hypothetical protein
VIHGPTPQDRSAGAAIPREKPPEQINLTR